MTTIHGTGQTQQGNSVLVGSRVKLLKSIYDDGEDHHPPGWIAQSGEVLIVKEDRRFALVVAHEENPGGFLIYPGEYETHNVEVSGAGGGFIAGGSRSTAGFGVKQRKGQICTK